MSKIWTLEEKVKLWHLRHMDFLTIRKEFQKPEFNMYMKGSPPPKMIQTRSDRAIKDALSELKKIDDYEYSSITDCEYFRFCKPLADYLAVEKEETPSNPVTLNDLHNDCASITYNPNSEQSLKQRLQSRILDLQEALKNVESAEGLL